MVTLVARWYEDPIAGSLGHVVRCRFLYHGQSFLTIRARRRCRRCCAVKEYISQIGHVDALPRSVVHRTLGVRLTVRIPRETHTFTHKLASSSPYVSPSGVFFFLTFNSAIIRTWISFERPLPPRSLCFACVPPRPPHDCCSLPRACCRPPPFPGDPPRSR